MRAATLALVLLALLGVAWAQPQLVVNGVEVAGASAALVPGSTYAPAAPLARALGARFDVDLATQRLTFTLGARVVQLRSVSDPAAASTVPEAVRRDGVVVPGPAAVLSGLEPFVPVKATAEALGASVTFLTASNQVLVVAPRADVVASHEGLAGDERLVLRASAPVRVGGFMNTAIQTLELRFERSQVARPSSFVGDAFVRADVDQERGEVLVRVQLAPEVEANWLEVPDGDGFAVVVRFRAVSGGPATVARAAEPVRVVLDPGAGVGSESASLTFDAVRVVAQRLERAGFEVGLTRGAAALTSTGERSALGAGARLFLSVQVADLAPGSARIYYLGDAADLASLEDAVRVNAEALVQRPETDAVRRALLSDLVSDLAIGERYAAALATALRTGGFQVSTPRAAPVALLTGAAGRGVLLEASAADLRDPAFADRLAAALADVLAGAATRP